MKRDSAQFRRIEFLKDKAVMANPPRRYRAGESADIRDWLAEKWIAQGVAKASKKQKIMLCARADSPMVVPSSRFDKSCNTCGARVMIAPSGQSFLAANPEATIRCINCYRASEDDTIALAAPIEQIVSEIVSSGPNIRANAFRERN